MFGVSVAFAEVGGYESMTEQFLWSASNNSFYYNSPDVGGNLSCGFVPENSFHIMRGIDSDYPWPGLVFGLTLLATYYWCTNQVGMVNLEQSGKGEPVPFSRHGNLYQLMI